MSLERPSLQAYIANSLTLLPRIAGQPGGTFPPSRPVVAGTHSSCELFSDHATLSQRHALFACQSDGRWWVYDLHSRRGVMVNGRRVPCQVLDNGDRVELGDLVWRVELPPRGGKKKASANDPLQEFSDLKLLHKGENGKLYRAVWNRKGREVALRIFPASFASDRSAVRRLKERLPLAGRIHHDNAVRLYRGGRFRDKKGLKRWFLVTEYMIGGSLRDRLAKRTESLPISDVIRLALEIGNALLAAEEVGLRHRNVNPSCIFFDEDGRSKLGDFLHARPESEPDVDVTKCEVSKVEMVYRPPEQIRGTSELTPSADLYSLAACLYEASTLRPPFGVDRSVVEVVQSIREERPASPLEFNPDLPPKLADLILDTLAKDPARRPLDANEFLTRLAKVMV